MPRPDCKSMSSNNQYELVDSRDWRYTPGPPNQGPLPGMTLLPQNTYDHQQQQQNPRMAMTAPDHELSQQQHDITLASLDADWLPLLSGKLTKTRQDGFYTPSRDHANGHHDETDFPLRTTRPSRPPTFEDEIDARGKFKAKDLEKELLGMRRSGELENHLGVSFHKVREILRRANVDKNGLIDYRNFLEVVRLYRLSTEEAGSLKTFVKSIAYAEEFTCRPPTVFMIGITVIELAFFIYLSVHLSTVHGVQITWDGPVPYCSVLIYNPHRRWEAWRFLTYCLVHIGIAHFVFNMIMQIIVGVFLEMEQEGWMGSLKVAGVYMAGVLAGSLGTSLSDPDTYVAGASGGVYALIAAHLATIALNWQEDSSVRIRKVVHKPLVRVARLLFIILLTLHDVGYAVYVRLYSKEQNRTGFMGHLCGAMAGLLVGVFVLDNRRVQRWEPVVQWVSFGIFLLMIGFAILWNVFGNQWTEGGNYYPKPDYRLYDDDSKNCKHYDYF